MTTTTEALAAALRGILATNRIAERQASLFGTMGRLTDTDLHAAREALAQFNAERAAPTTLGNRLMPGCECGAAEAGDFERCRCD